MFILNGRLIANIVFIPTTLNTNISNISEIVDSPHDIIMDTMRGENTLKIPKINLPINRHGTHNTTDITKVFKGFIDNNFLIIKRFNIEVISDKEPSPTTNE